MFEQDMKFLYDEFLLLGMLVNFVDVEMVSEIGWSVCDNFIVFEEFYGVESLDEEIDNCCCRYGVSEFFFCEICMILFFKFFCFIDCGVYFDYFDVEVDYLCFLCYVLVE